jgi:hypothetical protein
MKKKNTRELISSPLYMLLQVEGQKGRATREVVARKTLTKRNMHYSPQNIGWFCTYKKRR